MAEPPLHIDPAVEGSSPKPEPASSPYAGISIGILIVLAVIAGLIYSSRTSPERQHSVIQKNAPANSVDPYAINVKLEGVHMSTAENIAGGSMLYIEGNVTNTGNKELTGADVEVTFKNSMGQVVQRETTPVLVFIAHEPADDLVALNASSLAPKQSKEFRLTFERVSDDWDRQTPEMRVVTVSTK